MFARFAILGLVLVCACPSPSAPPVRPHSVARPCPAEAPAPPALPNVAPRHRVPGFWLARMAEPDAPLLTPAQIEAYNQQVRQLTHRGLPSGRWDVEALQLEHRALVQRWNDELAALRQAMDDGKRVLLDGRKPGRLLRAIAAELDSARPLDQIRVAHRSTPIRCYPTANGVYESPWDSAFDLGQCAQLRPGEPVRVLARTRHFLHVWSSYSHGWVDPGALAAALSEAQRREYLHPERFVVLQRDAVPLWADRQGHGLLAVGRLGLRLPLRRRTTDGALEVVAPTADGLGTAWIVRPAAASQGYPELTRRALLERAFELLGSPYGWGGTGGQRDCSRLVMDLFGAFGLELPRNSWNQSRVALPHVELAELDQPAREGAIRRAAPGAAVLLYLPGHIMLYLGEDGGQLYALHLFSGYLVPCAKGARVDKPGRRKPETMMRVNRTAVTTLELGRGSSRTAFIERLTRLVLVGEAPPAGEPVAPATGAAASGAPASVPTTVTPR